MKGNKGPHPEWIAFFCVFFALLLTGCREVGTFHSADAVLAYLEEEYPDQTITMSEKFHDRRGIISDSRSWTFTLSGFPEDTFTVSSVAGWGMIPFDKSSHGIGDNVRRVIRERVVAGFEQKELKALDRETRSLWKGLNYYSEIHLDLRNLEDFERAKELAAGSAAVLKEKCPVWMDTRYLLSMELEGRMYDVGATLLGTIDGLDYRNAAINFTYRGAVLEREFDSTEDVDSELEALRTALAQYYIIMADTGNGMDDAAKQAWCEERLALEKSGDPSVRAELGIGRAARYTFLDTGSASFLMAYQVLEDGAGDGQNRGLYLSLPEARELFLRLGLTVKGDREKFRVTGISGNEYEFSADYTARVCGYDYKINGEERVFGRPNDGHTFWVVDDLTIKDITGKDLYAMVQRAVR